MEEAKIKELAESAISEMDDLFVVDVKVKGNTGNQKVLVFIDGDNGISIDQCGKISRQIGSEMEEQDFMSGKYVLEVSSPGLDFPLTLHRQYVKNVGRELAVETIEGEKLEGTLQKVEEEMIELIIAKKYVHSIAFQEIKQSKVKVSFK